MNAKTLLKETVENFTKSKVEYNITEPAIIDAMNIYAKIIYLGYDKWYSTLTNNETFIKESTTKEKLLDMYIKQINS